MADAAPDLEAVRLHLERLQDTICAALEAEDGSAHFDRREIEHEGGGRSQPRVLSDGEVIERAAVHFTHTLGKRLPPAAAERRPELAGVLSAWFGTKSRLRPARNHPGSSAGRPADESAWSA